ncbi:hypothetical protein Q672_06820 [Marinobacter sp. EVN1]|jgi:thioredoxin|uniref:thioredoxin family protein n=1 Tax=Marinobacter sp. EVN1 TaxID=1397532 RepID=UPI0003B8FFCA|nr:thioredoxin family protein [Marinobacter sp. EVN1]ERS81019.1 hypothetical protein Q672_06820 [Marinobacter sp. EVN1]
MLKKLILMPLLLIITAVPAWANEQTGFTNQRFQQLQAKGALVLVDVHATWCPTCAKQSEILNSYLEQRPEADLHILKVNFDEQKQWVRHFRAPRQSTLLLYRGKEQIWFSVAETDPKVIFNTLDDAVAR